MSTDVTLAMEGVRVVYGDTVAVDDVSVAMAAGESLALLGPSGSGKSTLLRAVAGLEPLARGRICWAGSDLSGVPVHERGFGLMFQDYMLFPHRDVRGNVRFGLEMRGDRSAKADARVDEILDLVGLGGHGGRRITELSGGEQQRVALARALAPSPRLLMLDEPLGALDRALRTSLLSDLTSLFTQMDLPILYVTHDQEEALAVADRVAVMRAGRLEALAAPEQLWNEPPSEWVARFLGFNNIAGYEREGTAGRTRWGTVPLPPDAPSAGTLLLRPDGIHINEDGPISGFVVSSTFRGDHTDLSVRAGADEQTMLQIHHRGSPAPVGSTVQLSIAPSSVVVFAHRADAG